MSIDLVAPDDVLIDKFFNLSKPQDVADLLELSSYEFLEYILFILPESRRYTKFHIRKKNGGRRTLQEPIPSLKIIQHKLLQVLQVVYHPKHATQGFTKNRNIVTNASKHIKSRYVFNADLKDFFPSIHFGRVRGMFMAYPYNQNKEVSTILAQICSTRYGLPQGAPTSPIISNMICAKLDSQLQKLAKEHNCLYTRYADDLTFSASIRKFPTSIAIIETEDDERKVKIGNELYAIVKDNGFKINPRKTRLQTRNKRQEVTGLTTNIFVNVNRKFIRQIRAMLHAWEKYGYAAAEEEHNKVYRQKKLDKPYKRSPEFRQIVKGKIEFVGMVRGQTDKIFIRLNNKAAQLEHDSHFDPCLFRFLDDQTNEILTLIVHGETDQVEFKEGACFDPHTKKPNKKSMSQKILREVAAFMNSQDKGTLLIGVADDGTIPGIEREYSAANPQKANWGGYELFLTSLLNDSLSPANPNDFYNISKHVVNGKIICAINTTKADEPVLAKEKLFVRSGTTVTELSGRDKVNFIRNWT